MDDLRIPPGPGCPRGLRVPAAELIERFSHASGPGGQGVNTSDSRVQLGLDLATTTALDEQQRERALAHLGETDLINSALERSGGRAPLPAPQPRGRARTPGGAAARVTGPAAGSTRDEADSRIPAAPPGGQEEALGDQGAAAPSEYRLSRRRDPGKPRQSGAVDIPPHNAG